MTTVANTPKATSITAPLPAYSPVTELELANLSRTTTSSTLPPTYDDATATASSAAVTIVETNTAESSSSPTTTITTFTPTVHFQIETSGKQWLSLPIGTPPDPIPVYRVEAGSWSPQASPVYTSLRFSRGDSSCHLVRSDDRSQTPACTTLYRFGPGRPPLFRLPTADGAGEVELQIVSKSLASRTQILETPHGTFRWRYSSRAERLAVGGADDLLICELVVPEEDGKKTGEGRRRIAQFVRGEETRSKGTGRTTAGNGGRLMMDLYRWTDLKGGGRELVEGLLVASCICMLKKEVDRRRMHQIMILGAGAGAV